VTRQIRDGLQHQFGIVAKHPKARVTVIAKKIANTSRRVAMVHAERPSGWNLRADRALPFLLGKHTDVGALRDTIRPTGLSVSPSRSIALAPLSPPLLILDGIRLTPFSSLDGSAGAAGVGETPERAVFVMEVLFGERLRLLASVAHTMRRKRATFRHEHKITGRAA
jgi:hypothetical protein